MTRSHLARKFEQQTRKNLILSVLGIIAFVFIIFKFGIPLLVNFSLLVSTSRSQDISFPKKSTFIAAPILHPMPEATNSAKIIITGSASPNQTISLYINDNLVDKSETDKNGSFSFEETLSTENNTILAKAKANKHESDFSRPQTIIFKKASPSLTIDAPQDKQIFSKDQNTVEVRGKTDSDVRVTVNDFWAVIDKNNNFSYTLPLRNGENVIKVIARDQAGNKTEKEIRVTFSP